jgi:group I intron endonuclease
MTPQQFHFYKITNIVNGKSYIGYTGQYHATARWKQHLAAAKRGVSQVLYDAMRKYELENFTFSVLSSVKLTPEDAIKQETLFILEHKTLTTENGYNVKAIDGVYNFIVKQSRSKRMKAYYAGGGIHGMQGKHHTAESKQKMSETTKAMVTDKQINQCRQMSQTQWQDPEKRQNIIAHLQNPSIETRQKMSTAKKGKTSWNKGKPNTWTATHRSKTYMVTTPNGDKLTVINLSAFARKHKLSQGTLRMTATGQRKSHKGYSCQFAF